MSRIYAAGAAMGWTAEQVDRTSMWKFWSAWNGYIAANTPAQAGKLTDADKDEIWADIEARTLPEGPLSTETYLWEGSFVPQGRVQIS